MAYLDGRRAPVPVVNSLGEFSRWDGVMNPAGRGHMSIALPETDDPAITGAAQEQKIRAVGAGVVGRFDLFVGCDLPTLCRSVPPLQIPLLELLRGIDQCLPDLDQRCEDIRSHASVGSKCREDRTAAQERLEIAPVVSREM